MFDSVRVRAAMRAMFVHLGLSVLVASLMAALVFGLWFPHPFRDLAGGSFLFWILIGVDIVCGPLLTGIVFDPKKSRKELALDLSLIALIQLGALIYGAHSISQARPVVLAFETDRFVAVSASQIDSTELPRAAPQWQSLSWGGPILLGTRMSRDGLETLKSIEMSLRGIEPSARPDWWQSYDKSQPLAIQRMKSLSVMRTSQPPEVQATIDAAAQKTGLPINQIHYLPLVSQKHLDNWIALLDHQANIVGYAPIGGF
jgi:hypothetical protein